MGEKPEAQEFKPNIGLVLDSSSLQSKVDQQISQLRAKLDQDLDALKQDMRQKMNIGDAIGSSADFKQMQSDLKSFTDQAQALNDRAAQAVQEAWQKITGPIGSAFDKILDGAMQSHARIKTLISKALIGIAEDYAKMALQSVAHWAAMEIQKTLLSTQGEAARQAIQAPDAAKEIAQLSTVLAKFVATEAGKTTAVAASTTAQTSIQAAGHAAERTMNAGTVQSDAARAAAGAYAAVSGIPVVGPSVSGARCGSGGLRGGGGYESVSSAEGGWDRVPEDGAAAILHKNEMVLPAALAAGVRNMVANGVQTPTPSQARLGGTATTVNNSGDTSHTLTVTHNQTIHGGSNGSGVAKSVSEGTGELYRTMRSWYGKAATKLPGR